MKRAAGATITLKFTLYISNRLSIFVSYKNPQARDRTFVSPCSEVENSLKSTMRFPNLVALFASLSLIIFDSVAQNLFLEEEYIPELPFQESSESFIFESPYFDFVNGDTNLFEEDDVYLSSMSSHHLSAEASVPDWTDFSLNADFGDSETDIFFEDDDETFLADAASDDACVIQTNELILKARDGASCKAREDENLSPEDLQFLQDPMKSFDNLLPPEKQPSGSSEPPDPFKPSYLGILTE